MVGGKEENLYKKQSPLNLNGQLTLVLPTVYPQNIGGVSLVNYVKRTY